ncbi:hypothetical protein ACSMXN_11545 [Jatrophihabitans sp. DSM 45814]
MYRISREDNLETCLQQVDDPTERARLIEQAYKSLVRRSRAKLTVRSDDGA